MAASGKRGRKQRARTAAEKLWMAEFSKQIKALARKLGWNMDRIARKLGVSRASLYNYKREEDLPSFEIFKRAHDEFGFKFPYTDFETNVPRKGRRNRHSDDQLVLPLLRLIRSEGVQVVGKKTVGNDTLELTVHIRFGKPGA
jgi:transcriptional regulator with XRE-family HTH domain